MLEEGVVVAPEDIDLAMITGAGFSFWNGGLTMLLDSHRCLGEGQRQAVPLIHPLHRRRPGSSRGAVAFPDAAGAGSWGNEPKRRPRSS